MFEGLDIGIMLITIVVFIVLLSVLNSMLFQPLLDFMYKRQVSMERDEMKIEQNIAEANNSYTLASKILAEARSEASLMRAKILESAKDEAKQIIDQYKNNLDAQKANYLNYLESERIKLKNNLLKNSSSFEEALNNKLKEFKEI